MLRGWSTARHFLLALKLFIFAVSVPVVAGDIFHVISLDPYKTFYCGCKFESVAGQHPVLNSSSCGYQSRSSNAYVQLEHIVPVSTLAKSLFCWRSGGRKGCEDDPDFDAMSTDLHNIVPAVSEINRDRSNYEFGLINGEPRRYGQCDFELDHAQGVVEAREAIRGDIARIYFYMSERYHLKLDRELIMQLEGWSRSDPVDDLERARSTRITQHQGNINRFVEFSEKASYVLQ